MEVKIIVDSASDITIDYTQKMNLGFAPLKTTLAGQEYRDGIDIVPDIFYDRLAENKELAHTSQVNPHEFAELFKEEVENKHEVVVITISSGLSGTYQSACIAADDYPGKVFVVDSLSASVGEQVLIEQAIFMRDRGATAAEIYEYLQELRKKVKLLLRVDTLEYLKRGGRISKTSATLGSFLGIRPVLTLNAVGKLETIGKARGISASHKMINDSIISCGSIDSAMPVAIAYAGDPKDGTLKKYLEESRHIYGEQIDQIHVGQLGCVIGTHTGPGAIAVAFISKN